MWRARNFFLVINWGWLSDVLFYHLGYFKLASGERCPLWHWGFAGHLEKRSDLRRFPPLPAEGIQAARRELPATVSRSLTHPSPKDTAASTNPHQQRKELSRPPAEEPAGDSGVFLAPPLRWGSTGGHLPSPTGRWRRSTAAGGERGRVRPEGTRPGTARRRSGWGGGSCRPLANGGRRAGTRRIPDPPCQLQAGNIESVAAGHGRVVPGQRERKFLPASLCLSFFFFFFQLNWV